MKVVVLEWGGVRETAATAASSQSAVASVSSTGIDSSPHRYNCGIVSQSVPQYRGGERVHI